MSEVVTGDAVVLEVRVAQMPSRFLALLIDMAVQVTVLVVAFLVLEAFSVITDPALYAAVSITLVVLVLVGYPVIFETTTRGRSLGKLALGLRVVSDDGGPERFRQALFRGLAGVMEFWMFSGAPALISSLISPQGKRLGDLFAGTIVISERAPRDIGQAIVMPPPLAAWAATLEMSRLPNEVTAAARQYLLRWHDLSPQIQHEMGIRIATQVAAFVSPAAPAGVPPHAYLSAVLAERRRREQIRLARNTGGNVPAPQHRPPAYPQPAPYASPQGQPYQPAPPQSGPYPPPQGQPYAQPAPSPSGPYSQQAPSGGRPPAPESPETTPGGFAPPQ
ncbi:RDD family protein [Nonomuraea sp. LPB2021202275-12-8]|uniref:RDD family protein n=1 Tax=Nonomuraea sp. LPB2021202275-12-8 TaxID=3120159 RepID=UPI00300C1217